MKFKAEQKAFDSENVILSVPLLSCILLVLCVISFNLKLLEGNIGVTQKELLQFRLAVHFEVLGLEAVQDPCTVQVGNCVRKELLSFLKSREQGNCIF